MTLNEIKSAVEAGCRVHWFSDYYEVILDSAGQWLIYCPSNDNCIGLTWRDETTLNGKPSEFYIRDHW